MHVKSGSHPRKRGRRAEAANSRVTGRMSSRRSVCCGVLEDIIARIVAVARPDRVILFGSAARGTMGPNSDVDLLVIKARPIRPRQSALGHLPKPV